MRTCSSKQTLDDCETVLARAHAVYTRLSIQYFIYSIIYSYSRKKDRTR